MNDSVSAIKEIYQPREDSYLLKECVEKFSAGNVLEMGAGSGILSLTALSMASVNSVTSVDINPESIKYIKRESKKFKKKELKKLKLINSDLFTKVDGKFDTIIFNPPYLPTPKNIEIRDIALDGGKNGYELTVRFLNEVNDYLTQPGIILLLFSSHTKKEKIDEAVVDNCLFSSLILEKKLDFETLYVYKIEKSILLRELEMNGISDVKRFAKGKRGLVFKGNYCGNIVSIKSKNPNSESIDAIEREYKMIDFLRNEGIDNIPKIIMTGHDYFVYDFIDGIPIEDFIKNSSLKKVKVLLKKIMLMMRNLDVIGVNKEEMHRPHKHILIQKNSNENFHIIDFERCRESDKPQNVTQFCQYITSTNFNKLVNSKKAIFDKQKVMDLLKKYKKSYSEEDFSEILKLF